MEFNQFFLVIVWIAMNMPWIAIVLAAVITIYFIGRAFFNRCAEKDTPAVT